MMRVNKMTISPGFWERTRSRDITINSDAFFPPLRILAEHALQIAMALSSSSATEKNFQTGEDMFTDDDKPSLKLRSLALGKWMNLR